VPYLLVVGEREVKEGTVAVRMRSGKDQGTLPLEEFAKRLSFAVVCRGRGVNTEV